MAEYQELMWREMTESQFQSRVVALAKLLRWGPIYHTRVSLGSNQGYPDLHLVRGGRSVFAELKTMKGRASGAQELWLERLRAAGHEAYLWRPSDLPEIERVLG